MTLEKDFDPYLRIDGVEIESRDIEMLSAIAESGSLSGAAADLDRSYSRLQQRVVELEDAVGPLVERIRGGSGGGGGSSLTETAWELLDRFERLTATYEGVARVDETVLAGPVVSHDGELATVETEAGRLLAVVPDGADTASVTVRSDAVSLLAPDSAPPAAGTSVRNRFEGTVSDLEFGDAVARVGVTLSAGTVLTALVTCESVEKLDLECGDEVVASVKATAVRGIGVDEIRTVHGTETETE